MATKANAENPVDPFDPMALRIEAAQIPTERVLTAVPVRRPRRDEFFRVHPDEEYTLDLMIYEQDEDQEIYAIMPSVLDPLADVARHARLFTCISRRGTVFIWPAKLPAETGPGRRWAETALKCADQARTLWVRMAGDRGLGGYELVRARGELGEPKWPDLSFKQLMLLGFENRVIDRSDHPVIRQLLGDL